MRASTPSFQTDGDGQLSPTALMDANSKLRTRVSELEVIQDLFRSRVSELEGSEAASRRRADALEAEVQTLRGLVEEFRGSGSKRKADEEESQVPRSPKRSRIATPEHHSIVQAVLDAGDGDVEALA